MEHADMESILNEINERTNRTVKSVYDFLKEKSHTYGELEKNISNLELQIRWEEPDLADWLTHELTVKLKEEYGKMPLQ